MPKPEQGSAGQKTEPKDTEPDALQAVARLADVIHTYVSTEEARRQEDQGKKHWNLFKDKVTLFVAIAGAAIASAALCVAIYQSRISRQALVATQRAFVNAYDPVYNHTPRDEGNGQLVKGWGISVAYKNGGPTNARAMSIVGSYDVMSPTDILTHDRSLHDDAAGSVFTLGPQQVGTAAEVS